MNYAVTKDAFTKITETSGTLQNASKITTVEVSDSQEQNSGLLVPPLETIPLGGSSMFVRCVDGAGAEVRVVPFELEQRGDENNVEPITEITIDGVAQGGVSGVVALNLSAYAKKADVAGAYYTRGSVSSLIDLPATGNVNGDVYNILTAGGTDRHGTTIGAGTNVVYVEDTETPANSGWDALGGGVFDFTGAGLSAAGVSGLVPSPAAGDHGKFLRGDGRWAKPPVILDKIPVENGLWIEEPANNDDPVIKFGYNGAVYELGGISSTSANIPSGLPLSGIPLNDCTWNEISAVAQAGLGDIYWDVGDCKEITLNGNIGDYLTLTNEKLYVYILHFNYPMNGTPDNNIIFGGFKTADGTDVALVDSKYNSSSLDGTLCFNLNHTGQNEDSAGAGYRGTTFGGWKGTDTRYDILGATSQAPSEYNQLKTTSNVGYNATAETLTNPKENTLLAALPSDFRNALRLWSRWVDAKGNSSNTEAGIEETIDAITLLAEFEVQGARIYANEYEQNHQTQLEYYRLGNSKIRYRHDSTSTAVTWWSSSQITNNNRSFCHTARAGSSNGSNVSYGLAVAPAFKV